MFKIKGIIPHPQLNLNWQISKIFTIIICCVFLLINIFLNKFNINLYTNEIKFLDIITILFILIYKKLLSKQNNKNKIYYRKEYDSIKYIIFILNFILYGAVVRIIMNYSYEIIVSFNKKQYYTLRLFKFSSFNMDLLFKTSILYIIIILSSLYIMFYRKKYISASEYSRKIKDGYNIANKNNDLKDIEKQNYIRELNYSIFNKINLDIKDEKINSLKNKIEIRKINSSYKNKIITKEKIPSYGMYLSKEGKIFINGRDIDSFK